MIQGTDSGCLADCGQLSGTQSLTHTVVTVATAQLMVDANTHIWIYLNLYVYMRIEYVLSYHIISYSHIGIVAQVGASQNRYPNPMVCFCTGAQRYDSTKCWETTNSVSSGRADPKRISNSSLHPQEKPEAYSVFFGVCCISTKNRTEDFHRQDCSNS